MKHVHVLYRQKVHVRIPHTPLKVTSSSLYITNHFFRLQVGLLGIVRVFITLYVLFDIGGMLYVHVSLALNKVYWRHMLLAVRDSKFA